MAKKKKRDGNDRFAERRRQFAKEFCVDHNACQAALRAGYAKGSARQQACRLLGREDVQGWIAKEEERLAAVTELTQERVRKEIARLAFSDVRNYYDDDGALVPIKGLPRDASAAIREVESEQRLDGRGEDAQPAIIQKLKLHDKNRALELGAKVLGMLDKDSGQDQQPIYLNLNFGGAQIAMEGE